MGAKGTILAVSLSERVGTRKTAAPVGLLKENYGLVGDAHAGTERQVSLLADESAVGLRDEGLMVRPGDFGENLTVCGLELHTLPPGTRLRVGAAAEVEITQIGKACHEECAIKAQTGECVMPTHGVFARVVVGGEVRAGDVIEVLV